VATELVWPAVDELAAAWCVSPLVEYFLSEHPANENADSEITEALKNLQAGTGLLTEAPLVTTMWEPLAMQFPLVQMTNSVQNYLRKVAALGHLVESTVGFVRSRLPLYPKIPAPQMASRGFRRSEEYGKRIAWRSQLLAAGLESYPSPPGVTQQLQLSSSAADDAAQSLLEALRASAEWVNYKNLAESLTEEDRAVLKSSREKINVLLNPRNIDQYEDARMERRHAFRIERVKEVVEEMTGVPREFADAFESIDDLIDRAIVNVHGQLVVYGRPKTLIPEQLEMNGRFVSFNSTGDAVSSTGDLIRLEDPLVPDVLVVDGFSFQSNQDEGVLLSYTAERLPASTQAFLSEA
jgi:hypothetical protein